MELSKWAHAEARGFCRQYDEKRRQAHMLHLRSGTPGDGGGVERQAARREKLLADIALIEDCAREIDGGRWYLSLIRTCCQEVAYDRLPPDQLPTSNRNAYFKARRQFLTLVWLRLFERR